MKLCHGRTKNCRNLLFSVAEEKAQRALDGETRDVKVFLVSLLVVTVQQNSVGIKKNLKCRATAKRQ